jgi:hypothetical protein
MQSSNNDNSHHKGTNHLFREDPDIDEGFVMLLGGKLSIDALREAVLRHDDGCSKGEEDGSTHNCNSLLLSARNNDVHSSAATPTRKFSYLNPSAYRTVDNTTVASTFHRAFSSCNYTTPPVQIVEFVRNKKGLALIATQPIPRGSIVFTERAMECVQLPRSSNHSFQNYYVKACQQCFRSLELIDCCFQNVSNDTNTRPVTMLPFAHLWPVPDYPWYLVDGRQKEKNAVYAKNKESQSGIKGNAMEGCYIQCCECSSTFCSMKCYQEHLNDVGSCCSCQEVIQSLYYQHDGSEVVPQMPLLLATKMFCSAIQRHRRRQRMQQKGNHDADYHSNDEILHQMCGDATDINLLEIGDEEILVPCSNGQNTVRSHYSLKRNYDRISNLLQLTEMEQQMYNVTYLERLVSIAARNGFDIKTESPFEAYYRAILRQSIVAGGRNTEEHRNVVSQILSCLAGEDFHIDRRTIDANLSEVCCVSALALFPLLSKINHSCQPNVEVQHGLFKECIVDLVAKRNIDKGEELTVSYINLGLDGTEKRTTAYRRKILHARYLFWCDCPLCSSSSS